MERKKGRFGFYPLSTEYQEKKSLRHPHSNLLLTPLLLSLALLFRVFLFFILLTKGKTRSALFCSITLTYTSISKSVFFTSCSLVLQSILFFLSLAFLFQIISIKNNNKSTKTKLIVHPVLWQLSKLWSTL